MRTKQVNEEVIFSLDPIVKIDRGYVHRLKEMSEKTKRRRVRFCAHKDIGDPLHEMFIVHAKETYVRPHRHRNKAESFHIIEGVVDVIIFNDKGWPQQIIAMGDYNSGQPFYYRIEDALYHTLIIKSELLVFHESASGPFNREETEFAPWAPEETESEKAEIFRKRLEDTIASIRLKTELKNE